MRFASSTGNASTSRNVSTWRSGMTKRWVSAFGLMSRTATKPSASWTWSPSRYRRQKRQSSGSADPLLGDRRSTHLDERADGRVDEPGRVIRAVSAAGAVDEHLVV